MQTAIERTVERPHRLVFLTVLAFLALNLLIPGESNNLVVLITSVVVVGLAMTHYFLFKTQAISLTGKTLAVVFVLILILSHNTSIYAHGSLKFSSYWITLVLLTWIVSDYIWSERQLRVFAWLITGLAGALSAYGLLQIVTFFNSLPDLETAEKLLPVTGSYVELVFLQKRIFATFVLPTSFSVFLAVSLPFSISLVLSEKKRWRRFLAMAIVALSLAALVQTKSHGGLAALGVGALVVLAIVFRRRGWPWVKIAVAFTMILLAVIALIVLVGVIRDNFLWDLSHTNSPIKLRWHLWMAASQIFSLNTLSGVGSGNFSIALFPYVGELVRPTKFAHNTYLQLAAEWGVIGAILCALIVLLLIRRITSRINNSEEKLSSVSLALMVSTCIYLAANGIEIVSYFQSLGILGAVLIGLMLRKATSNQEDKPQRGKVWKVIVLAAGFAIIALNVSWYFSEYLYNSVQLDMQNRLLLEEDQIGEKPDDEVFEDMLRRLDAALVLNNADFRFYLLKANLLNQWAQEKPGVSVELYQEELAVLTEAVKICPQQPNIRNMLATSLARQMRFIEAGIQAQRAAELYPYKSDYQRSSRLLQEVNRRTMLNKRREVQQ
jgi:O-antigen ligase